jgi:hypothetical protein
MMNKNRKFPPKFGKSLIEKQNLIEDILGNAITYFSSGGCVFVDEHIVLDIVDEEFIRIGGIKIGEAARFPFADPDLIKKVRSTVRELRMGDLGQLLKIIIGPKYGHMATWHEEDKVMDIDIKGDEHNDDTNICYLHVREEMISIQSILVDKIRNKYAYTPNNIKYNGKNGVCYPLGNPNMVSNTRRRIAFWLNFWKKKIMEPQVEAWDKFREKYNAN